MNRVGSIGVPFALLLLAAVLALLAVSEGGRCDDILVEGTWLIDEPTTLRDGSWTLRNVTLEIESTLEIDNATLRTEGYGMLFNVSGRLVVRNSTIEGNRYGTRIVNRGTTTMFDSEVVNFTQTGTAFWSEGSLWLERCNITNGHYCMRVMGDLVVWGCTISGFDGEAIQVYAGESLPTEVVVEATSFTWRHDPDRFPPAISIRGLASYTHALDVVIRGCRFEDYTTAISAGTVKGSGTMEVVGNTGVGCGVGLYNCGEGVLCHHNSWGGGGIYVSTTGEGHARVHNDTVLGGYVGFQSSSEGTYVEVWDLTIVGTVRGVACAGGTLLVHRSILKGTDTDWYVYTGINHNHSRIFIRDCIHNGTVNVTTEKPDCGVYELARMRFVPVSWHGVIPIEEGVVQFRNETGSLVGTLDLADPGPVDLTVFEASTTRFLNCSEARAEYRNHEETFHSGPFSLAHGKMMSLTFVDDLAPVLEVNHPADGEAVVGLDLEVSGSIREAGSGVKAAWARVDLDGWSPLDYDGSGCWTFWPGSVPDGTHTFSVRAVDMVGNEAVASSVDVVVDSVRPFIEVVRPGHRVNQETVWMTIRTEVGSTARVNDLPALVDGAGRTTVTVNMTTDVVYVNIWVRDRAGNVNETVYRIEMDLEGPVLVVEDPLDGRVTNATEFLVQGYSEMDACVTVNGDGVERDGEWFTYLLQTDEGVMEVVVEATDPAGNPMVVRNTMVVDWSPPELLVLRPPVPYYNTTDRELTVSGTIVDITDVRITVSGEEASVLGMDWFIYVTLADGPNELVLEAVDEAGNVARYTMFVRLDRSPPEVLVMLIWEGRPYHPWDSDIVVGDGRVDLQVILDEPASLKVMDGPAQALEAGTHFMPVTLAPGTNIVYIDARDQLGNEADRVVFDAYMDNSPPVPSARGPRRSGVGSELSFDGTGSTDDHGIVEWTWSFSHLGQNVSLVGPTPRFAFQEPGTYAVTMTVTDSAGNSASDSLEVVVGDEGSSEVPWTILAVAVFLAVFLPLYLLYSRHLDRNG